MGNTNFTRAAFADWHAARHHVRNARKRMRGGQPGWGFGPGPWTGFGRRHGGRMRRGGMQTAILALLAEEPMHGYQIIQELGKRSGGAWTPGAGSIYPALEMMEANGLVTGEQHEDKRVYTITDKGRELAEHHHGRAPWDEAADASGPHADLGKSVFALMNAVQQISRTGTDEQVTKVTELVDQARKQVYLILAE